MYISQQANRENGANIGCHGYLRLQTIPPLVFPLLFSSIMLMMVCVCVCVFVCLCVCVCVAGLPKRYGLKEAIEEKWRRIREIETHGDYHSTYSTAFR